MAKETTKAPVQDEQPTAGGSYTRNEDGSLTKQEGTDTGNVFAGETVTETKE